MDLFLESDYRKIIKHRFAEKPNGGRGQASLLARRLGVNTTLVSQVLGGKRDFTEEQAVAAARFLAFNQKETLYFLLLVQHARAANADLKTIHMQQIQKLRSEARSVQGRVTARKELTFEQQAVYYSSWLYAAVHTLVSIPSFEIPTALARALGIEEAEVRQIAEVLIEYGLISDDGGRYSTGATSTYLPPESPFLLHHHQNWRQMAVQQMTKHAPRDYHFTGPLSISKADYDVFRQELVQLVGRLYKLVEKSPSEEFACVNIDFFKI